MRGRVFSANFVIRDVCLLLGMAGAGLADVFDIRTLIVVSSGVLVGAASWRSSCPASAGLPRKWRRSLRLLASAPTAPRIGAGRPATMLDFDRLMALLPELGRWR